MLWHASVVNAGDQVDQVFAADIGSVSRGRFGWHGTGGSGESPAGLVKAVSSALSAAGTLGRVALGFECPTYVPVHEDPERLGGMRPVDRRKGRAMPWSAAAGTSAMATGLVQAAWILAQLAKNFGELRCTVAPARWSPGTLLLWEAFISGEEKAALSDASPHSADAEVAVTAFRQLQRSGLPAPTINADHGQLNLLAVAARWAHAQILDDELWMPTLVAPQG